MKEDEHWEAELPDLGKVSVIMMKTMAMTTIMTIMMMTTMITMMTIMGMIMMTRADDEKFWY